jgi:hypothetical protein
MWSLPGVRTDDLLLCPGGKHEVPLSARAVCFTHAVPPPQSREVR